MSAHKEANKQRKRKSLKMALEKCMQRRDAAATIANALPLLNVLTTSSLTATSSPMPSFTTTSTGTVSSLELLAATTTATAALKEAQKNASHEMSETTETETSLDTSAELAASELGAESKDDDEEDEDMVSEESDNCAKLKDSIEDKPLDFTHSSRELKDKESPLIVKTERVLEQQQELKELELKSAALNLEISKIQQHKDLEDAAKKEPQQHQEKPPNNNVLEKSASN